jgi:inosine-uridine nucleoside N-ribohydrolase
MKHDPPTLVHLDTDIGSDTDDLCALAMLLGWPGVELIGVTTVTDPGGRRAGFADHALRLAGRPEVPVVAGSGTSLASPMVPFWLPAHYWPEPVSPRPAPAGAALELLEASAELGAVVVAIGPLTNLAMLEASRPGLLASTRTVLMGGHVTAPRPGLPPWGVHDDFNVQQDRFGAMTVLSRCNPVVVPLAACLDVTLRRADLPRLRSGGPLARLVADQSELHEWELHRGSIGRAFPELPDDLLNFQYDPLAAAVAVGWDGATIEEIPTRLELREERLWMTRGEGGIPLRVVTGVDGERFRGAWMEAVLRAAGAGPR